MTEWRVAHALETLRSQVNAAFPHREKSNDGSIGDDAHAARTSDHNAWIKDGSGGPNVVSAIDITHDPKHGFDSYAFADYLRTKKDQRIKYVISNRWIFSATESPWEWRPYKGADPHDHHVHISVKSDKAHYDDTTPWAIAAFVSGAPVQIATSPTSETSKEITMNPLSLLSLIPTILRIVPTIKNIISQGLSLNTIAQVFQNSELQEVFKAIGGLMFPDVKPEFQASAAVAASYDPNYVMFVQNAANKLVNAGLDVDGHYGPLTQAAVKKMQTKLGVEVVDGWVGDKTKAAINTALSTIDTQPVTTPSVAEVPK